MRSLTVKFLPLRPKTLQFLAKECMHNNVFSRRKKMIVFQPGMSLHIVRTILLKNTFNLAKKAILSFFFSAQECRQLKYSQPVQDKALNNHVIMKINITREDICNIKCFIEPNCLSFNVGPLENNNQYLCEISDSDDVLHPGDLAQRVGFIYQGTQVFLEFYFVPGQREVWEFTVSSVLYSLLFHQYKR